MTEKRTTKRSEGKQALSSNAAQSAVLKMIDRTIKRIAMEVEQNEQRNIEC